MRGLKYVLGTWAVFAMGWGLAVGVKMAVAWIDQTCPEYSVAIGLGSVALILSYVIWLIGEYT